MYLLGFIQRNYKKKKTNSRHVHIVCMPLDTAKSSLTLQSIV